jgi:excisionase family DNA binding protein
MNNDYQLCLLDVLSKREEIEMERMTMNVKEMALQLGISRPKAYELVKRENFPAIFLGKRIVIPVAAFEKWLMESTSQK